MANTTNEFHAELIRRIVAEFLACGITDRVEQVQIMLAVLEELAWEDKANE